MVARSPRLLVLLHRREPPPGKVPYRLWDLCERWRARGIVVHVHRGLRRIPAHDIVLPHIDLTVVPAAYARWIAEADSVINRAVLDLSKRIVSKNLLAERDAWSGPVIVKTDRNHGGLPERRLSRLRRVLPRPLRRRMASPRRTRRSLAGAKWMGAKDYAIFPHLAAVPAGVFRNRALVVERFLPEVDGERFALRSWSFLGDAGFCARRLSLSPVVRPDEAGPPTACPVPDVLREERVRLGLDYGKLDFVCVEGEVVLLDASRTPGLVRGHEPTGHAAMQETLAEGIRPWLARLT